VIPSLIRNHRHRGDALVFAVYPLCGLARFADGRQAWWSHCSYRDLFQQGID
jgi:hypothetical protein